MAKQRIEIEVDVPDGHRFSHVIPPTGTANYLHDGKEAKCGYLCVVFPKNEPVRESRWGNLYDIKAQTGRPLYESRRAADCGAEVGRLRVIRIDYENGVPVSVAIERAEGGG